MEVAVEGVGIAQAATDAALRYAAERVQGKGPEGTHIPIIDHPDVRRMLLLMMCGTEGARALTLQTAAYMDESEAEGRDSRAQALLGLLLPICKAASSEMAVQIANTGVQIHGGAGFTRAFRAEQYLRDSRILPIYEGTTGIQAIDLVMRKIRKGRPGYAELREEISKAIHDRPNGEATAPIRRALETALASLERATGDIRKHNDENALAAAADYLSLISAVSLGWMWLRMANASDSDHEFGTRKRVLANFFAVHCLADSEVLAARVALGARYTPKLDKLN
jgi:hypothetical protein